MRVTARAAPHIHHSHEVNAMRLEIHAAVAATLLALAFAAPVRANDAAATPTPAAKRADCAHEKDAKGATKEDCDAHPAREPQTHKMTRCNEEAGKKQLHGDERRAFMSSCLRG
jgi:psiF repeat-containing protein